MHALPLPFNVNPFPHLQTHPFGVDKDSPTHTISAHRFLVTLWVVISKTFMSVTLSFSFAKISINLKTMQS